MYESPEIKVSESTSAKGDVLGILLEVKEFLFSVFTVRNEESDQATIEAKHALENARKSSVETKKVLQKYDLG